MICPSGDQSPRRRAAPIISPDLRAPGTIFLLCNAMQCEVFTPSGSRPRLRNVIPCGDSRGDVVKTWAVLSRILRDLQHKSPRIAKLERSGKAQRPCASAREFRVHSHAGLPIWPPAEAQRRGDPDIRCFFEDLQPGIGHKGKMPLLPTRTSRFWRGFMRRCGEDLGGPFTHFTALTT
jgi:hypothetical protein